MPTPDYKPPTSAEEDDGQGGGPMLVAPSRPRRDVRSWPARRLTLGGKWLDFFEAGRSPISDELSSPLGGGSSGLRRSIDNRLTGRPVRGFESRPLRKHPGAVNRMVRSSGVPMDVPESPTGWATHASGSVRSVADVLSTVRHVIARIHNEGVRVPRTSRLRRYEYELQRTLDHLGSVPPGAGSEEAAVLVQAPLDIAQLNLVLDCLPMGDVLREKLGVVVGGSAIRAFGYEAEAKPRNIQHELFVGALFAYSGLPVSLEEPDLRVELGGQSITLACKRPRSSRGLEDAMKRAKRQIRGVGLPGLVALALDSIILGRSSQLIVPTPPDASRIADGRIRAFLAEKEKDLHRWSAGPATAGVLAILTVPTLSHNPPRLGTVHSFVVMPLCEQSDAGYEIAWAIPLLLKPVVL